MLRFSKWFVVFMALVASPAISPCRASTEIEINDYSYAAIAYSPSTGEYAYAYNYGSRRAAEQAALARCKPADAKIVCWVNNGFCALALGDEVGCYGTGYSWGHNCTNTFAKNRAVEECNKRTGGARVVVCLTSDGQYVYEPVRMSASR